MATTVTSDIAGLVPEVISARTFDTIVARVVLSALAEQNTQLEGGPGDRLIVGTFADIGEAEDLAENAVITPKAMSATAAPFIVGRIGDGVAYTRDAAIKSGANLNAKAGTALGNALARRIDRKLALNAVNGADPAHVFGDGTTPLTPTLLTTALGVYEDTDLPTLVTTSNGLQNLATSLGAFNASTWGGGEVIREGVRAVARLLGVNIVTMSRLPVALGVRSSLLILPGRTLVSAYAQRPTIDTEVVGARNAVELYANSIWAGGAQEPATLAVIEHDDDAVVPLP